MISKNVTKYLRSKGWWFDDASEDYKNVLNHLGVEKSTDMYDFYTHAEDGPTFYSRGKEIYQLCWFILNSNYDLDIKRTHEILGLDSKYIPLDSFEGERGFFYNKETGEVMEFFLGEKLEDSKSKNPHSKWKDFNTFIEWFFEL